MLKPYFKQLLFILCASWLQTSFAASDVNTDSNLLTKQANSTMHFDLPVVIFNDPEKGKQSYWGHFQHVPMEDRLLFEVTEYGLNQEDVSSSDHGPSMIDEALEIDVPFTQVYFTDKTIPYWGTMEFVPNDEGKLLFEVPLYGGFKTINGQVSDPIVDATVEFYDNQGEQVGLHRTATDVEGKFALDVADKYTVAYAKVRQGLFNNAKFKGEMVAGCSQYSCNITPFSSLSMRIASLYQKDATNQTKILLNKVLGFTEDPFIDSVDINKVDMSAWREKIDNGNTVSIQLDTLSNDITDGYLDKTEFDTIFKQARHRPTLTVDYTVDKDILPLNQTINEEGEVIETPRNLVLESFSTQQTSDNNQITTQDYPSDVILKEVAADGSETIIYQSFQVGKWRNKLNVQTTTLSKIFLLDFGLANLPEEEKVRIAEQLLLEQAETVQEAETVWLETINTNILTKLIFDEIINELIGHARTYAIRGTVADNLVTRRSTYQSLGTVRDGTNEPNRDLGWVEVSYAENSFKFKNFLPLYMSVTSGGYSFDDNKFDWVDALYSPNLMDPAAGGGIGMLSSGLLDLSSKGTPMSGTTFDKDLFPTDDTLAQNFPDEEAYCSTGQGRYVVSKKLAWSIHSVNNAILAVQALLGTTGFKSVNFNKITSSLDETKLFKKAGETLTTLTDLVSALGLAADIITNMLEQTTLADDPDTKLKLQKIRTELIDPINNAIGNLQSIIDNLSKITDLPQATKPETALDLLVGKTSLFKNNKLNFIYNSPKAVHTYIIGLLISNIVPKECELDTDYGCSDFAYLVAAEATGVISASKNTEAYNIWNQHKNKFTQEIGKWIGESASSNTDYKRFFKTLTVRATDIVTDLNLMNGIMTAGVKAADNFPAIARAALDIALAQTKGAMKEQARYAIAALLRVVMGANAFGLAQKANDLTGMLAAQLVMPDEYPFDIKVNNGQVSFEGPALQYSKLDYNLHHILDYNEIGVRENKDELGLSARTFSCSGSIYQYGVCKQPFFILDKNIEPSVLNKSVLLIANKENQLRTRNEARFYFNQSKASVESVINQDTTFGIGEHKNNTMLRWTFNIQKLKTDGDTRKSEDWADFNPASNKVPNPTNPEIDGNVTVGEIEDVLQEYNGAGYFDFFDVLAAKQGGWWTSAKASVLVNHKSRGIYRELFDFKFVDTAMGNCGKEPTVNYPERSITYYKMASAADLMDGFDSQNPYSPGIHFQNLEHNSNQYLCITNFTLDDVPLTVLAFTTDAENKRFGKLRLRDLANMEQICFDKEQYQDYTFTVYDAIFTQYAKDYNIWPDHVAFKELLKTDIPAHVINSPQRSEPEQYHSAFIVKRTVDQFQDTGPGLFSIPEIEEIPLFDASSDFFPKTFDNIRVTQSNYPEPIDVAFTIQITRQPEHGTVEVQKQKIVYDLNDPEYLGTDSFEFIVVTRTGVQSEASTMEIEVVKDNTSTSPGTKEKSIQHVNTGFTHYFGVEDADMSKDGCWVVFTTQDKYPNIDENDSVDAYVRNMCVANSKPELISVGVDETGVETASGVRNLIGQKDIAISANGRYITFPSGSENIFRLTEHNRGVGVGAQIFIRDRAENRTYLISIDNDGNPSQGTNKNPSISSDGRVLVFESSAYKLDPNNPVTINAIYAYQFTDNTYMDRTVTLVNIGQTDTGNPTTTYGYEPLVSGNGQYVIFRSDDTDGINLTGHISSNRSNGGIARQIFLRDLQSNTLELISVTTNELTANREIHYKAISYDGNFVAFTTNANNLLDDLPLSDDKQYIYHIYVRDRNVDKTYLVTTDNDSNPADGNSAMGQVNTDLSIANIDNAETLMLAFTSKASNLSTGGDVIPLTNTNKYNTYVQLIDTLGKPGRNVLMSKVQDEQGNILSTNSGTRNPVIADNGEAVIFVSGDRLFHPVNNSDIQGSQVYWWGEKKQNPPTNFKAVAGDGEIALSWDAVENATYNVYWKVGSEEQPLISDVKQPSYLHTELENDETYSYQVTAIVNGIESSPATGVANIPIKVVATPGIVNDCEDFVEEGSDNPETHVINIHNYTGIFEFNYKTHNQEDRILVEYEGKILFDTGCVGKSDTEDLSYSGNSNQITVRVEPNCYGGTGTKWDFRLSCP